AMEAAQDAEKDSRYEDAALILGEVIRKDPAREAELRDRRDLAVLRAGRQGGSVPSLGGTTASPSASTNADGSSSTDGMTVGGAPRVGTDYLDPANKGKLFPV